MGSQLVPSGTSIRSHSDNVTTVQALNHFGSTSSLAVTFAVQEVMEICKEKGLLLEMHRIPGHLNVLADALSRNYLMPGEWEIHPQDWTAIISLFSAPGSGPNGHSLQSCSGNLRIP